MDIIVGGGKYGCDAVEYLRKNDRSFVLVDPNPSCLAAERYGFKLSSTLRDSGEIFVHGNLPKAVELIEHLKSEYVFPTAPIHVVAEMAKIKFRLHPWDEGINRVLPFLPVAVVLNAGRGNLIVSFNRDNDCFEKCSMPEVCPSTKIRKPCSMYRLMKYSCPDGFILTSHLMSPGMGAIKSSEILEFFEWAERKEDFVVATACDCHGVFSSFTKNSNKAC
jgi:hypothetical protein